MSVLCVLGFLVMFWMVEISMELLEIDWQLAGTNFVTIAELFKDLSWCNSFRQIGTLLKAVPL